MREIMNGRLFRSSVLVAGGLAAAMTLAGVDEGSVAQAQVRKMTFRVQCPAQVSGVRRIVSQHTGWRSPALPAQSWQLKGQTQGPNMPAPGYTKLICRYAPGTEQGPGWPLERTVKSTSCQQKGNGWDCVR